MCPKAQNGDFMRKWKVIAAVCAGAVLLGACTTADEKAPAEESSVELLGEQELMERNTEDIRDFALRQEDADQLVSERLEGTGCQFKEDGTAVIDENHYYIYRITKDGETVSQGLAVDDVSGEVSVYDFEQEAVAGYEEFEYYDADRDAEIMWDGTYYMEEYMITLLPADAAASEIHVSRDGKELLVDMIYPERAEALLESSDFTVSITKEGDELLVEDEEGKSGFSGTYVLE